MAPNSINKKAVKVNFRRRGFTVCYENKERLKIGTLYGDIDVDACTWTIDGTNLVITCEKRWRFHVAALDSRSVNFMTFGMMG